MTDIKTLLKSAKSEICNYVSELESENLKLQKKIAKFEVNKVSSDNRIFALENEIKKSGSYAVGEILKSIQDSPSGLFPKNKNK